MLVLLTAALAADPTPEQLAAAAAEATVQLEQCAEHQGPCAPDDAAWSAFLAAVQRYVDTGVADGALAGAVLALKPELFEAFPDVIRGAVTEPPAWVGPLIDELEHGSPPEAQLEPTGHPIVWAARNGQLKPGFYKDLEELRSNAPSLPFEGAKIRRDFWRGNGRFVWYHEIRNSGFARRMGKLMGFSDGERIYVHTKAKPADPTLRFAEVTLVGPYAYYMDLAGRRVRHNLIDLQSGRWLDLTHDRVRWLFASDPVLLAAFEQDQRKLGRMFLYLGWYFERRGSDEPPPELPRGLRP